jgi:hypothetical protein
VFEVGRKFVGKVEVDQLVAIGGHRPRVGLAEGRVQKERPFCAKKPGFIFFVANHFRID